MRPPPPKCCAPIGRLSCHISSAAEDALKLVVKDGGADVCLLHFSVKTVDVVNVHLDLGGRHAGRSRTLIKVATLWARRAKGSARGP